MIISLLILFVVGHAILMLIAPRTMLFWCERWAVAYLLGAGALSIAWFALSPLYGLIGPKVVLTALAVALAALAVWRGGAQSPQPKASSPFRPVEAVLCGLLAIEFALVLVTAIHIPLGWDGLFNWEIKARLAFENIPSGRMPTAYFSDTSRTWSHPRYPLLVPFTELWAYIWLGRVDQSAIKFLFPLFYFSLIGILCGAVRRMTNLRVALATGLALGLLPPVVVQTGATSGYADIPLAAAIVGAVSFALIAMRTGDAEAITVAAALSTVAVWTKAEGLVLAGVVGVLAVMASGRRALPLVWMPLLVAIPWLVIQRWYAMPEGDFLPTSPAVFVAHIGRLPAIVAIIAKELLLPGHWGLVWPVCAVALALMVVGRASVADWFLAAAFVIPLALYTLVFVFSNWPSVSEHVHWAIPRLLTPLAPLALMFTVHRLWGALRSEVA